MRNRIKAILATLEFMLGRGNRSGTIISGNYVFSWEIEEQDE